MANNIAVRDASGQLQKMRTTEVRDGLHVPHQIVRSLARKFVDTFNGELTDLWDITSENGGSANVAGGILSLTAGTLAGAYVEMLSKDTFTLPFRMMAGLMNTRHGNNHCIMELVSVDPETGIPDGLNCAQIDIGGAASATATQMKYSVQNGGLTPLESAVSTIASTATYSILEIEPFEDEAWFHSRVIDAATGRSASYCRHQQLPDPNATYKVRIRSQNHTAWKAITNVVSGTNGAIRLTVAAHAYGNGGTVWVDGLNNITNAGAKVRGNYVITVIDANTFELNGTTFAGAFKANPGRVAGALVSTAVSFNMQFLNVQDYDELKAEIVGGRGNMVAGQGIGVNVIGTVPISGAVTMASTIAANSDNIHYTESIVALAADATFNGTSRDVGVAIGVAHRYSKFNLLAFSPEAGSAWIEVSTDNVNWRKATKETPAPAGEPVLLAIPVMARYTRGVYKNGGTAQTQFLFTTSFTAA